MVYAPLGVSTVPRRRSSVRTTLLSQLTKPLVERALEIEITDHLRYERHQEPPRHAANTRNETTSKPLITEHREVPIHTPRDRDASFSPKIVKKRQPRFEAFDYKILALYSRVRPREISRRISPRSTACTSAAISSTR